MRSDIRKRLKDNSKLDWKKLDVKHEICVKIILTLNRIEKEFLI